MRQKYCREKRNLEVKRRNKLVNRNSWVLFDRLHFLDAFIQPRAYVFSKQFIGVFEPKWLSLFRTFTNDTGFVDEHDQEMVEEGDETENFDEASIHGIHESRTILLEVDESVDANDLDNFIEYDRDNTTQATCQYGESFNRMQEVRSEYTGDVSQIVFLSECDKNGDCLENGELVPGSTIAETEEQHHHIVEQNDPDYMSQHASTSSSYINAAKVNSSDQRFAPPVHTSTADKAANFRRISTTTVHRSSIPTTSGHLSGTVISSQKHNLSQRAATAPTNGTPRHTTLPSKNTAPPRSSSSSNRTVISPNTMTAQKNAPPRTVTTTSNEKSIEIIRHKMDSCLTALQNKITDKTQRSPHAPFLAYLGTKLVNVPKEILSNVEEEILDVVKNRSG